MSHDSEESNFLSRGTGWLAADDRGSGCDKADGWPHHFSDGLPQDLAIAREAADRVIFMDGGVVVEQGTPEEVIAHPQHPRTQAFLSRFI